MLNLILISTQKQLVLDVSSDNDLAMDEGQNGDEGDSDVSDSNDGIDDFSQVSADETVDDNGIDSNQDEANSSDDNLPTDATQGSAPIADAGEDFEVDENTDVRLDGSASVDHKYHKVVFFIITFTSSVELPPSLSVTIS